MTLSAIAGARRIKVVGAFALRDQLKAMGARFDGLRGWDLPRTLDAVRALDALGVPVEGADDLRAAQQRVERSWPAAMRTQPWDHQREAFDFCLDRGGSILAVRMGGGKSAVALALLIAWRARLVLVSCPLSVIGVWAREIERHAPGAFRVVELRGPVTKRAERAQWAVGMAKHEPVMLVTNHDAVWRGKLGDAVLGAGLDALVIDEAHKIKAPGGKASRFLARVQAPRRLGLTGTFLPNGPLDAYGQMRAIDPTVFGTSFHIFRSRYAVMGGFGNHQVLGYQAMDEFKERLGRAVIRLNPDLSLPPITDPPMVIEVDLSAKAKRAYAQMREHMIAEIEAGEVTAANALVKSLRLAQLASGLAQPEDGGEIEVMCDAKVEGMREALSTLVDHDERGLRTVRPAVVFCRFVRDLERVHKVAAELGLTSAEISGARKDGLDDRACMPEGVDVNAVQLQSGGVGISLIRASVIIHMGLSWSAADYEQSIARVHRPGQERAVTHALILARGTIDMTIRRALAAKMSLAEAIMQDLRQ